MRFQVLLLPISSLLLSGAYAQSMTLPTEAPETDNCPACTQVDTLKPCSPDWIAAVKACQEPPCNRRYIQDPLVANGCGSPVLSPTPGSTTTAGDATNPEVPYPMPTFSADPEDGNNSMSIPEGTSTGTPILTDDTTPTFTTAPSTPTAGDNTTKPDTPATQPDGNAAGKVGLSVMALVPVIVAGLVFAA